MIEYTDTKMPTEDNRWHIWVQIYKDKKYIGAYALSRSYASKRSAEKAAKRMVRSVMDFNGHRYARFFAVSKTNPCREFGIARPKSNGNKILYDREAFNTWAGIDQQKEEAPETIIKTPSGEVYTQDSDKQGWTAEVEPDSVEPFYAETEPQPVAFISGAHGSDAFFRVTGTPEEIFALLQSITGGDRRTYEISLMEEVKE